MRSQNGRLSAGSELPKSITFHDFCELTQRQLADLSLEKKTARNEEAIWRVRPNPSPDCIHEEAEDEDEPNPGTSPSSAPMAHAHWHSLSTDDRDPAMKQTKKRKRPFNATFSSWLQLFMARRRHRHNRFENGHQGLMHQSCYEGLAGPNGGPLRSSVSLCKFLVIINLS